MDRPDSRSIPILTVEPQRFYVVRISDRDVIDFVVVLQPKRRRSNVTYIMILIVLYAFFPTVENHSLYNAPIDRTTRPKTGDSINNFYLLCGESI